MAQLKIRAELRSVNPTHEDTYNRHYDDQGNLIEERILSQEQDYASGFFKRVSSDNGRTWSEWETLFDDKSRGRRGKIPGSAEGDELLGGYTDSTEFTPTLYDPKSGCKVGISGSFYYIKGHDVGYFDIWEKGEDNLHTHAYFGFERPDGTRVCRMLEFEEGGADFDPENPRNPAFLDKNRAYIEKLAILPDGDLSFIVFPTVELACRLAHVDVNTIFPSCPKLMHALMVARAHWNAEKQDYEITYSNPIILSDLQSSRGCMEPLLTVLPNGRWLLVFRGSPMTSEVWHTRTNKGTPGFKWYTVSYDGGRTFAPPMPWHFDTREVVYSPASISGFFRSSKNGRLYWIGNFLHEPWLIHEGGNAPRWPLQICEVDQENGYLIKDTLTEIDTRREGDTYWMELSNFNLLENRETQQLELRLTKICQHMENYDKYDWYSEAWCYYIDFD